MVEDDLAIADAEADTKRQRTCPLPDGSKRDIADVSFAKTGFGDAAFIGCGVDAFARSVVVGSPPRPLIWSWHAIEVCGGWGGVGRYMAEGGFSVVNIELKLEWDFIDVQFFRWITHVVLLGRVRYLFLEPPCTTCSLAREPGLRDTKKHGAWICSATLLTLGRCLGLLVWFWRSFKPLWGIHFSWNNQLGALRSGSHVG